MKALYNHFIFLLSILILASCKQGGDIKIGFLMPDGENSRWPIDQRYVENAAKNRGVEVISRFVITDENLQQKQASELLELGIDVLIIVSVNANTAAAMVREAHNYNVPVIAYDRLIKNADLDCYVTFEGASIGNIMVDHALEVVPKGNYVLLYGDPGDNNAIFIKDAQEAALKPYVDRGDINIVYRTFVDNWAADNAYQKMSRVLAFTDKEIDAVITSYDGLAIGAMRALKEYPNNKVKVLTGQDAEPEAIQALLTGEMSLTVYKSIREIANATVDIAVKLAKKQRIDDIKTTIYNGRKDVPTYMLQPVAVHKNNIRATIIADEYYTEEQVYGIVR
jgi:D-xylose transport system substrate-binding protein